MVTKRGNILVVFLLLSDLVYSFLQHYHIPLDGDMAAIILPASWYAQVLEDPFGWTALMHGEAYGGSNRFFCHWFLSAYYKHVPLVLQNFVDPVESVYLAGALLKTGIQLLMIGSLAAYISKRRLATSGFLLAALLVTPLFQTQGYNQLMGIIERSPTYAVFYSLPVALLLLFYLPLYRMAVTSGRYKLNLPLKVVLVLGAIVLPFSGPLIPAIAILTTFVAIGYTFSFSQKHANHVASVIPVLPAWMRTMWLYIGLLCLVSVYSVYIGTFNSEQQLTDLSIWERYLRMPRGLFWQFAHKVGLPLLLFAIIVNYWLVKRYLPHKSRRVISWLRWLSVFVLLYLLILPFGGFREYRSLIIRRDTMLPVTLSMVFIFGLFSYHLLTNLQRDLVRKYLIWLIMILFVYTLADEPRFDHNSCEKEALREIGAAPAGTVHVEQDCTILSWEKITDPRKSYWNARLLELWNITDGRRLYYH